MRHTPRLALAALAAAALAAAPSAGADARVRPAGAGEPLPGLWRYDTSFLFSSGSDTRCIGPHDIAKVLQGPSNSHYDCTYPVREVGGGHARFEGTCVNHKHGQSVKVSLRGAYGPTSFDLDGVVQADLGGVSLPIRATISAKRLSPTCPVP